MRFEFKLLMIACLFFNGLMFCQNIQEDFSDIPEGSFPENWQLIKGEAMVKIVDTKKVLDIENNSIVAPQANDNPTSYLDTRFVLEFDAYFDRVTSLFWQRYELRLWNGVHSYSDGSLSMQPIQIHSHGAKTSLKSPELLTLNTYLDDLKTLVPVWRHIKVEVIERSFKLFIDDVLILECQLPFQPEILSIGSIKYEPSVALKGGITNIKINTVHQEEDMIDGSCSAFPTERQLDILMDSTSLFNRRLRFLEAFDIQQLRGIPEIQEFNGRFSLPPVIRSNRESSPKHSVIPIVAHILRKSNRQDGLALNDLYWGVNNTNELFLKYGFYFYVEEVIYINDDTLFNTTFSHDDANGDGYEDEVVLLDIPDRNVARKLNIYYVPSTTNKTGGRISWANFPSKDNDKQHIVMRNSHMTQNGIMAHEVGHWLNLLHTHETGRGRDAPGGIDCAWAGDLCCDTPPDNNLSGKVDEETCEYTANESYLGIPYNPDPLNIMSYTASPCAREFSDKQLKRLYNAYLGMDKDRGYTFKTENRLGEVIANYNWTSGWNEIEFFELSDQPYMLFFKTSTGEVAIHRINNDGKKGAKTATGIYGNDWSLAKVMTTSRGKFLLTFKSGNGLYQIRKINANGSISNGTSGILAPGDWKAQYVSNGGNYLVLISKTSNKIRTYTINSDGTMGNLLYEKNQNINFDIFERIGSKIMCYNSANGELMVLDIQRDGKFKRWGDKQHIDSGISSLKYLQDYNDPMVNTDDRYGLIGYKPDYGEINIHHVNKDLVVSEKIYDSSKMSANLNSGYDVVTPYHVTVGNQRKNFIMFSDSRTGEGIVYHMNK